MSEALDLARSLGEWLTFEARSARNAAIRECLEVVERRRAYCEKTLDEPRGDATQQEHDDWFLAGINSAEIIAGELRALLSDIEEGNRP